MTTKRLTMTVAALSLVGLLGACGGGGGGGNGGGESGGGSGEQASGDGEELYDWVECMGGEGIDLPEPTRDANGDLVISGDGVELGTQGQASFGEYSEEEFMAGTEVCGHPPLRSGMSEESLREEEERVLAMSECMRENGVEDFPDPDFEDDESDGMFTPWPQEAVAEAQSDPDFEAADETCRDLALPEGAEPIDEDEEEGEGSDG